MQQVLLNTMTGETAVVEAPVPALQKGHVLIRTRCTLISAGTERMLVEFGRASLVEKARQQPEKVRMVLDKVRTDGVLAAIDAVRSKLDQPLALGYCNVGTVIEAGEGVTEFRRGDRVVSNGSHAEVVSVPKNLCARVPEEVEDESAVFTVLGAIGLQGLRLAEPTLGETVVVIGLGLIGLMTVQMLRAQGCRVMGIDYDAKRVEIARGFGAQGVDASAGEDVVSDAVDFSRGRGVDAVIVTASTSSSSPISQAAKMCRKRGRIVLVGVTGLELSRQDFYEKELTFRVSCSYGPGRYDAEYEQKGQDYPLGFVRWTEQRNFEAVLDMMASGSLDTAALITHRYSIEQAEEAYSVLGGEQSSLGIVLRYPPAGDGNAKSRTIAFKPATKALSVASKPVVGCIGAGNYGGRVLIPAIAKSGVELHTIASANGLSAVHYGKKFGFANVSSSTADLLAVNEINTLFVATRHDSHARLAADALRSGRHVYVEKPLALTSDQLEEVERAYRQTAECGLARVLMVGFNRRFSPHSQRMREMLQRIPGPKSITMLMNAGVVPATHWAHDPVLGGGRILGEACHFIDLARYLIGAKIVRASATAMGCQGSAVQDTAMICLEFEDASVASIQYYSNGHRAFPKERVEVFASGRILQLENFRVLRAYGISGFKSFRTWRQDKGHSFCVDAFVKAVSLGGAPPIPAEEIFEVSRIAIEIAEQANGNKRCNSSSRV